MTLLIVLHVALRILGFAFLVLLAWRIAVGLGAARRRRDGGMGALERRFVAGELSEEDFRRMRKVLEE